jgi:hypothetical protein
MTVQARTGADTDATPVTATVSLPTAHPRATVEIGFVNLGGPTAPVQQVTADDEPDVNLDAGVNSLLANGPATNWNAVSAFMANVVPWPGSDTDPGHVGLWYSMPNPGFDATKKASFTNKKQFISGWPYRAVDQFVSRAGWVVNTASDKFHDVWLCTSLQAKQDLNKKGKPKARKSAADALRLKSLWVDLDVKADDPKCYASLDEAWTEFSAARKRLNLPRPSAVVRSGGGLQVWWISKTALLPHEWAPYAQGLKQMLLDDGVKFDPTCTADSARLMRVPGTFNHKYDPPRPVELLPLPLKLYDFAELDFLKQHAGVSPAQIAATHQLFAEGANMESFKAGPVFKIDGEEDLQAGIDKFGDSLVDPLPIFMQCGFYQEALTAGGANNDQPQWNLAVLGTSFMEDGNAIAHRISKSHATYSEVDTQALYDRKMVERTDRGIGYPSCAAVKGSGCKACATCPLFQKGKSPLNIRPEPNQGAGAAQQTPNSGKESAGSEEERLLVPKDDHMERARIYRSTKRSNLYHYRDDFYDHEDGHY